MKEYTAKVVIRETEAGAEIRAQATDEKGHLAHDIVIARVSRPERATEAGTGDNTRDPDAPAWGTGGDEQGPRGPEGGLTGAGLPPRVG